MKLNYKKLGDYIEACDILNEDMNLTLLQGISNEKYFQSCKSNTVDIDLSKYRVCRKGWFAYNRATTRNGEKISIAYREKDDCLVSPSYKCFRIKDEKQLSPYYLLLWFKRSEFDRYARFMSHGSAHEYFEYEQLAEVQLPVPPIEEQEKIVDAYQKIEMRIALKEKINNNLETTLTTEFRKLFLSKTASESILLGEIIQFGNGKSRPKNSGSYSVYGGNGILDYVDTYNAENIVAIGRVGAYCGSVYIETQKCWISDNAISAKSKLCEYEYYDYFLLKSLNLFNYHVGTGQQLLTQEILNRITIIKPNIGTFS